MKISTIKPFSIKPIVRKLPKALTFKANIIDRDYFSPQIENKYVKIKNLEGENIYATITKQSSRIPYGHNAFEYIISHNKENLGYAIALDREGYDGLYLSDIYTQENKLRQYKGLGTELLKCIVQESYKKGYGGKVMCCAYHQDSPFVFYYKNNFRICENEGNPIDSPAILNASLQYVTKNSLELLDIFPRNCDLLFMELDKKGADAFMNNIRLYKDVICDDVGNATINGQKYIANFVKFPNEKEYYLQIINDDSKKNKLALILSLNKNNNLSGKHFQIINRQEFELYHLDKINEFADSILDDLAQKYL